MCCKNRKKSWFYQPKPLFNFKEDELHLGLLDLPIGGRVVAQLLREDPTQPVVDEGVEQADEQCNHVELGVA
jgi:hypothetical protein